MINKNSMLAMLAENFTRKDTALIVKRDGAEISFSWEEVARQSGQISDFLIEEGLKVQDKVGILANNSPEWTIVDFACLQARVCSVPLYTTNTAQQIIHILNDSEVKIVFVGSEKQKELIESIHKDCPNLKKVVLIGSEEYKEILTRETDDSIRKERMKNISDDDLITLIYTSGTTGMPKGVMLSNLNFRAGIVAHKERILITKEDRNLCFLPLSHVFERAWSYYVMTCGSQNYYLEDPQEIAEAIKEIQPTVMSSVPRFFEKVYSKVQDQVDKAPSSKQKIFKWATRVGRKVFARKMNKEIISPLLLLQHFVAKKLVFNNLKNNFGGKVRFFNCGGASLQDDVNLFFQSVSLPIIYGYGMTETLATVSCYSKIPALGSVGKALPGVEIQIDKDNNNEILVRGDTMTKGYYNLPEENEKLFTKDGWLRTGDAGRLDAEGNLYYVERIKELMKTSNGKYIAPQNVEGVLMKDKFIEQAVVIAEGETFVSALLVPNYEAIEDFAKEKMIEFKSKKELLEHSSVVQMIEKRIEEIQKESLQNFEKVKKFKLLEKPLSIVENEITPTLKLKRKVIMKKYKQLIDDIYNKKK